MAHPLLRSVGSAPLVIAHRGASADAPENTPAAFELGFQSARWLETDVQPTADGVPVLLHDPDVARTTDGSGAVRKIRSSELATLDAGSWFDARYADERVPHLATLLAMLPPDGHVLLEIKGPHDDAQLATILRVVEASSADERVLLQSFERDELSRLHRMRPDRPLGLLTTAWDDDPVAACASLGAITYNPYFQLLTGRERELHQLHEAGISSAPYTADDPVDWAWLDAMGIDGIITNRPRALAQWLDAR